MAQRKLQQDIDKLFKKVAEGVAAFEAIYEKLQQTANASQKEKLEDNLKREIKKLQRQRDQIKTWAAGNEVKDKKPLLEQRKLIEAEMEKFKAVEKEMKTKAFSKEGLSAAAKLDPKEREKLETCQFLSEMVEELERQIETLEAEEEALQATVKKGKKDTGKSDRLAEINRTTEKHKWHQGKLELLLRSLENGNVETDQVTDLKESIKYYVEENQGVEFMEDDSIYDDLNLEQEEEVWGINNDGDRVSSQDTQSIQEDPDTADGRGATMANGKGKSSDPSTATVRRPSNQSKSPLPALATLHTPLVNATTGNLNAAMKPAPIPTRAPGEVLKYASAAAAAATSDKNAVGIAPLPPPPGAISSNITANLAPGLSPAPFSTAAKSSATTSPSVTPSIPASVEQTPAQKPVIPVAPSIDPPPSKPEVKSPTLSHSSTAGPSSSIPSSLPPTPALEKAESALPPPTAQKQTPAPQPTRQEEKEPSPEPEQPKTPSEPVQDLPVRQRPSEPQIEAEEDESIYHLPPGLQDLIQSFEVTKSRANTHPSPSDHRLLSVSHATCPDYLDAEKPRHYRPSAKYNTPRYYPQEPSIIIDDPNLYGRIDTDTLFYIFYYRQGTYQQYLAAKSLKNQSWRFHKQYQTWFQRHEEPKTITEEYEQGTYRFFDYESTW
ncbi:MAG: general negative regulator of transcription subunit 5 [Icmadophila ericetorum]|nr:general negative regulator of transcription subunit 5 [Icmadophila ericetorum]